MGEFSVVFFLEDGRWDYIIRFTDPETAVATAFKHSQDPGDKHRIIITDAGDFTVFEWVKGEGIVFPKREDVINAGKTNHNQGRSASA